MPLIQEFLLKSFLSWGSPAFESYSGLILNPKKRFIPRTGIFYKLGILSPVFLANHVDLWGFFILGLFKGREFFNVGREIPPKNHRWSPITGFLIFGNSGFLFLFIVYLMIYYDYFEITCSFSFQFSCQLFWVKNAFFNNK